VQSRANAALTLTTLAVMAVAIYLPFSPLANIGLGRPSEEFLAVDGGDTRAYVTLTHNVKSWFVKHSEKTDAQPSECLAGRTTHRTPGHRQMEFPQYLAHLIEAIPEIGGSIDLAEQVKAQEQSNNTGIGLGVACPHVRVPGVVIF